MMRNVWIYLFIHIYMGCQSFHSVWHIINWKLRWHFRWNNHQATLSLNSIIISITVTIMIFRTVNLLSTRFPLKYSYDNYVNLFQTFKIYKLSVTTFRLFLYVFSPIIFWMNHGIYVSVETSYFIFVWLNFANRLKYARVN